MRIGCLISSYSSIGSCFSSVEASIWFFALYLLDNPLIPAPRGLCQNKHLTKLVIILTGTSHCLR